jgi:hypothetical protein
MKVTQQELETRKIHAPDSTKPPKENKIGIQFKFNSHSPGVVGLHFIHKKKNKQIRSGALIMDTTLPRC